MVQTAASQMHLNCQSVTVTRPDGAKLNYRLSRLSPGRWRVSVWRGCVNQAEQKAAVILRDQQYGEVSNFFRALVQGDVRPLNLGDLAQDCFA